MMQSEEEKIDEAAARVCLWLAGLPAWGHRWGQGSFSAGSQLTALDGLAWNLGLEVKVQTQDSSEVWRRPGLG